MDRAAELKTEAAPAPGANLTQIKHHQVEKGIDHMPETLSIDLQASEDGKTHLFVLHGDLDVATSPALRAALTEAASHGKHHIIVDLSRLGFLDSTGLGALIAADKQAKANNGEVRLVAQEGQILRLLRITGLLDVFRVYPDIDAALLGSTPLVGM